MQLSALLLAFFTQTTLATWPKRGVPFNDVSLIQQFNGGGSEVNWAWNWDSYMPNSFPTTMEFIPCLWSDSSDHTSNWAANVNAAIARGTGHVMAFNEPDACGGDQSCMSPQQAVNAWKTYIQPFAGRVALGAPQVTNGASGLPWLESFLSLCTGCQIDFVPIHWYEGVGGQNYLADFYNYVGAAYAAGGNRPIWVTEVCYSFFRLFLRFSMLFFAHYSLSLRLIFLTKPSPPLNRLLHRHSFSTHIFPPYTHSLQNSNFASTNQPSLLLIIC